jgi:hypothetical protein
VRDDRDEQASGVQVEAGHGRPGEAGDEDAVPALVEVPDAEDDDPHGGGSVEAEPGVHPERDQQAAEHDLLADTGGDRQPERPAPLGTGARQQRGEPFEPGDLAPRPGLPIGHHGRGDGDEQDRGEHARRQSRLVGGPQPEIGDAHSRRGQHGRRHDRHREP